MIKKIGLKTNFIIRHFFASVVSIVAPVILIAVAYFVLLLIAVVKNSGLGSPVALPLWAIVGFVVSTVYTALLLFPSILLAEIASRIFKNWQHVMQIPVSVLTLAGLTWLISFLLKSLSGYQDYLILHWADYPLYTFLALLLPLGLYWWTMKVVQIGVSAPVALFKRLRQAQKAEIVCPMPGGKSPG